MKKHKVMVIGVAISMVLIVGASALAQMHGMGFGPAPLHALMELGLSDAQRAQIAEILITSKADREIARQKHEEVMEILAPVLEADVFHEDDIRAAFNQASGLMEDVMVIKARIANQIRAVLTDAQQQSLKEQREKGIERMKKHAEFEENLLNTWLKGTSE